MAHGHYHMSGNPREMLPSSLHLHSQLWYVDHVEYMWLLTSYLHIQVALLKHFLFARPPSCVSH